MLPTTIDGVLANLKALIGRCWTLSDRRGYFASLYWHVTSNIRNGIETGMFKSPDLVEKLDVIFANRFLAATQAWEQGGPLDKCWELSFRCDQSYWPLVAQHLMVACNAHIDLDLGVAVAQAVPEGELGAFKADFEQMNNVLASVLNLLNSELVTIWPLYKLVLQLFGKLETGIIDFGMAQARERAWSFAVELSKLTPAQREPVIARRDSVCAIASELLWHPPWPVRGIEYALRQGELNSVREIIEIMRSTPASSTPYSLRGAA